jgi:hypothetical protein
MRDLPPTDASTTASAVVELRQYALHPGRRETLIDLFDREFVETQEAVGMRVMGQFRDLDRPDHFVWLRGFADMPSRAAGLQAFYGGPVWAAHRDEANATMLDSDDVLLLRPAWPGSALPHGDERPAPGTRGSAPGVLDATVFHLAAPADDELLAFCRTRMSAALHEGGSQWQGWYVTEPAPNNFPRLPVREGEQVLVGFAMFENEPALAGFADGGLWQRSVAPELQRWLSKPPQTMRLAPTARSRLRAVPPDGARR